MPAVNGIDLRGCRKTKEAADELGIPRSQAEALWYLSGTERVDFGPTKVFDAEGFERLSRSKQVMQAAAKIGPLQRERLQSLWDEFERQVLDLAAAS
ncbi:hypothetical protein ACYOEI_19870 [Singulisphaera rosea]